jgi:hypothetical protein
MVYSAFSSYLWVLTVSPDRRVITRRGESGKAERLVCIRLKQEETEKTEKTLPLFSLFPSVGNCSSVFLLSPLFPSVQEPIGLPKKKEIRSNAVRILEIRNPFVGFGFGASIG